MAYTDLFIIICTLILYFRIGMSEYNGSVIPFFISLGLWGVNIFVFKAGWIVGLTLQIILFAGLTYWNVRKFKQDKEKE